MDEPKKYIRTLEGDIKAVEEGGKPDLAPLIEPQPSAKEQLVASSPFVVPPVPLFQNPPEPIASVEALPPVPRHVGSTPIRTYSSDFSNQVKETGAVTATIIAAEQDAALEPAQEEEEKPERSKKNPIFIIGGAVLVLAGIGGAGYAYVKYAPTTAPIITEVAAPIFVDERQEISGSGTFLLQAIEQSVTRNLAPRTVRFLYTASSTTDGNSIFTTIPISVPDIVRRNVNARWSMAGVVNTGKSSGSGTGSSQSAFFIISVSAYRDTFAGMLAWEGAMPNALSAIFPAYPVSVVSTASTTLATTTPGSQTSNASSGSLTSVPGFRDEVVSNHDVRVYRDSAGRSVLLYGYWNQSTLVIARDPLAFAEIIGRLSTARTGQ